MGEKKQVKLFIYWNLVVLIIIVGFNYITNPFYLFHKPICKNHIFVESPVFLNLGLIETFLNKTDDYDSILIGTSHTMNFIGNQIAQSLNTRGTIKLCLSGGHPVELETIAQKAFRSKKVKKVLLGFETMYFPKPAHTPHPQRIFPYFLYTSFIGKYSLLLSYKNLKEITWSLIYYLSNHRLLSNRSIQTNLDKVYYYYDKPHIAKMHLEFPSKTNLEKLKNKNQIFKNFDPFYDHKSFSAIDTHFIPLIENYPEIEFHVLLIPYSCTYFAELDVQKYQDILACQRYLIEKSSIYSNVRFYAFHTCQFPHNLANYYNSTHYHPDINRYMLYAIQNNQHRLTLSNLDAYEKAMIENLRSFEVQDAYPQKDTLEDLIKNEAQVHSPKDSSY